jgi:2-hydroxychromene-2-carboxylate isomerase
LKSVEFLYDFSSPNCYVAYAKVKDLQRKGKIERLAFTPVLLGGLFKNTNDSALPKGSLEYNYMAKNLERLSKKLSADFRFSHERFPINSLRSVRGSYFAKEAGKEEEYIQEVFNACWSQDKDITKDSILKPIVENSLGLDFSRFISFIEKDETKQRLRSDTQNALEKGVFRAPTFFVDEDMYWGTPEIL